MRTISTHWAASIAASGLKWMSADDGHQTITSAQVRDDILQVGRVLHRGRCDADQLATDGDQVKRLLHAFGGVHRVAGEHRLHDDWVIATDDHAAARRITDDDLPSFAAVVVETAKGNRTWPSGFREPPAA
jgi:hypothetical protein